MAHEENTKVLILCSQNPVITAELIHYLTEKGYPKVEGHDLKSQIQHLANAGQHRIITGAIDDFDDYHRLQREFPGEVILVGIAPAQAIDVYRTDRNDGKSRQHLVEIAPHYIKEADLHQMQRDLHVILDGLHFLN